MFARHRPHFLVLLGAGLILAACKDTRIVSYRVPKEAPDTLAAVPTADASPAAPAIHWRAPAGWQPQTGDAMRLGSWLVTGTDGAKVDISVTTFPGDVGGDLANVNRWRAQLGLAPIDAAGLPEALAKVDGPAGEYLVSDLEGNGPAAGGGHRARIVGAILKQPGQTWFFKMSGEAQLTESQKPAFLEFLKTVQLAAAAGGAAPVGAPTPVANTNDLPPDAHGGLSSAGKLPPGHPPIDLGGTDAAMDATPVPVATGQPLVWTAPSAWRPSAGSAMRKGSYAVTGPEGTGDLAILAFPGDVGGNLANVNRWRGQLDLPPVADLDGAVQTLDANGLHMLVFDGANGGQAILGAIVPRPGETWFFKLSGPAPLVARTKPAFLDFLRTVHAP